MWHCRTKLFHRMLLLLPLLALIATAVVHTASASEQVSHICLSFPLWPISTYSSQMQSVTVAPDNTQSVGLLWMKDRSVAETCTHNTTHTKRQTSMPLAGFGPAILASKRPQTYALDRTANGNGESRNTTPKQTDTFDLKFFIFKFFWPCIIV